MAPARALRSVAGDLTDASAGHQEDDGLTFGALHGARYRTTVTVTRHGGALTVRAEVDGDGYPEFRRTAFRLVVHGAEVGTAELDGGTVSGADGVFTLPNAGSAFTLRVDVGG